VREYANNDTDFLVNLTNDGWSAKAQQWQRAGSAVFAVENGSAAAASSSLTCWIDSRRLQQFFASNRQLRRRVMTAQSVPPGEARPRTFRQARRLVRLALRRARSRAARRNVETSAAQGRDRWPTIRLGGRTRPACGWRLAKTALKLPALGRRQKW
jgi:hypothetical protein